MPSFQRSDCGDVVVAVLAAFLVVDVALLVVLPMVYSPIRLGSLRLHFHLDMQKMKWSSSSPLLSSSTPVLDFPMVEKMHVQKKEKIENEEHLDKHGNIYHTGQDLDWHAQKTQQKNKRL